MVEHDASDSNEMSLLIASDRAGYWTTKHPEQAELGVQWLGHAVQLMTKLPPTMVTVDVRASIYHNYGYHLCALQ
jgi:hypothetical protein